MDRIILLIQHKENRQLLAEWLGGRYEVELGRGVADLHKAFDLGILDGPMLERLWKEVQARRKAEEPAFLPFLLVTSRQDVRHFTRHLWRTVDELALTPIERLELAARVEILLRARRQSLELYHRYYRLFENVPLGLYRTTPDGRILEANRALLEILGYSDREELLETKVASLYLNPEERARWQEKIEQKEKVIDFTIRLRRRDGTIIWAEDHARAVKDPEGRVLYYEGVIQDISERVEREAALRESRARLERLFEQAVDVLAAVVEVRDPYTAGHQRRVAEVAWELAAELGLADEEIRGLRVAALVHDIGKIQVPAEILNRPGKLSPDEMRLIKTHPEVGYDILKNIDFPWPVAEIVLQHHERLDGSGYPRGLKGEEILLEARILAVADVTEAMLSHRPYRPAHPFEAVQEEIEKNRGKLYDPEVVDAWLRIAGKLRQELVGQRSSNV